MIFRHLTIDCADPYELATFWSAVTGWPVSDGDEPGDSEVERIMALGATLYEDHRTAEGLGWVTLLDPEGNEFCVERSTAERGI
jgi:predicted enzyme related to lactoylglutathione lyase